MSNKQIIERLNSIQEELDEIRRSVAGGNGSEWRAVAGSFANDPLFEKAVKFGAEYRKSLRPRARRKRS
ncbi:MAG TPA: hypothetical protein VHQ47_04935 [Phycisphaerae bacterium]|jgi:hypothetical protein|nr:hypothetical protein [Phycisphaerae bacterium]HVX84797.1 hypothetical protein [Phycisphaerae bacterium]